MARVILVRHGEAAAIWGGDDPTALDPGLSDLGRGQAAEAARLVSSFAPRRILTSPMRRCRETATAFADLSGLSPTIDPAVSEIASPPGEPDRTVWLRRAFAGTWGEIEGDDYAAWRDGVVASVAAMGHAVVFTHFVAINAAVSAATGSDRVVVFRPANASLTVLETDGRTLSLVELGREAEGMVL